MAIKFLTSQNIQAGTLTVSTIANLTTASDTFLVSDGGLVKYRTAAEVRSDIGAGTGSVTSITITPGTGISGGGTITSSGTLTITNTDLGSSQAIFKNIAVAGESTIVADSNNDTLTFINGSNITITTNATTDTITISASDTNNYPTSLAWDTATGILTLGRNSLSSLTVDLDNRYAELGTQAINKLTKWNGSNVITESIIYDDGTNIGIGTTSPSRTLHVLGQAGIGTVLKLEGASGTTTYLQLAYNGATNAQSGYISYDSSANMGFFTNDSQKAVITSAGSVGIGTNAPGYQLAVSNGGAAGIEFGALNGNFGEIYTYNRSTAAFIQLRLNGSTIALNDATAGNVLIGTTTDAGYKLDVNGAARIVGTLTGAGATFSSIITAGGFVSQGVPNGIEIIGPVGSPAYGVTDQSVNNGGKRWRFGYTGAIGGFGSFDFYNQTDNITALTLASTGAATFSSTVTATNFIGAGTGLTGTASALSIGGNAATATNISNAGTVTLATATESNSIYITQPSYTTDTPVKLLNFAWYSDVWSMGNIRSGGAASNGFGIYLSGAEKVRIDTNGNLGLGTTSFNLPTTGRKILSISGTTSSLIEMQVGSGNRAYIYSDATKAEIYSYTKLDLSTNGAERISIQANGNVLINTTTDAGYKLDVNGTARFTGQVVSNTQFYAVGTPPVNSGALMNIRDTNADGSNVSFGGVFFNSSPGSDYSIGKLSENSVGFLQIRNGNNGAELLRINSTGAATFSSSVTATSLIKSGGTSTQYLMADGSTSTLTNPITGTGTTNYLPKFTGASALGNSALQDDGVELRYSGADGFRIQGSTSGFLSIYGTTDNYIQFVDAGGAVGYIRYNHTSDAMSFRTNGTDKMFLNASGNLLIGTTTDAGYKLDVNGNGRFSGNIRINSVPTATSALTTVAADWANGSTIYTSIRIGAAADSLLAGVELRTYSNYAVSSGTEFRLYVNNTSNVLTEALRIATTGAATFSSSVTASSFSNAGLQSGEVFNATKSNAGYFVGYLQNSSASGYGLYIQNGSNSLPAIRISNAAGTVNAINLYGSGIAEFSSTVTSGGNFELTSATTGLKSNVYDTNFYANSAAYWNVTTAAAVTAGALLFKQGYEGTTKGYVYWDSSGFGLLTNVGDWAVRANYGGSGSGGTLFGAWSSSGSFTATNFIVPGGTSAQFLKADGSLDSSVYLTSTSSTFSYTSSVTLSPTWQNTGVSSTNLGTGAYLVTCNANDFGVGGGQYDCTYTGLMYFFAGATNGSDANEIVLHHTGHADNGRYIYLRTLSTVSADGKTYLQISGNGTNSAASNYQFTFKKLL
jgi:hypothetical protein